MVLLNSDTYYLENKVEIIKLKDTITEMKNSLEGIINLHLAEEKVKQDRVEESSWMKHEKKQKDRKYVLNKSLKDIA